MREMKIKKRKTRLTIILILTTIVFLVITISNRTFADPASETANPVDYSTTKQLRYPSIFDLLPADQRDGEYVYIRYEDWIKFPSIFCCAKGVTLPNYRSTLVHGRDRTDGGKLTGYLTLADQGATVFKDGKIFHNTGNPYAPTSSKTYGRFHIVGKYKATPAEGWVISEMDMNDPEKNSIAYELTNQEWTDLTEIVDTNKHRGINNTTLWAVEWDDTTNLPTKFVTESGGKYYVVTTDEYAPLTYVQYAWWKVKKVGMDDTNPATLKDTDLAYEAEAFEEYIKRIAVYQNDENYRMVHGKDVAIGKWQWNADNTIKVDYKNYTALDGTQKQLGYDASKYEVRFNAETNKYVVGPFTLDYLRTGTKQGTRDKVSFSGISQSSMFGLGADGQRLLDSNGKSVLQLQTAENPSGNYRFVYDHDHEAYIPTITTYYNGQAKEIKLDTADDYPYPYDGEEFYIEIDYLDDLVSLESLDFDFQYMNAGGEFEYLEGEYLIIHWVQRYNKVAEDDTTGTGGTASSSIRKQSSISLGMADLSNRAAVNADISENNGANDVVGGTSRGFTANDTSPIKESWKQESGDWLSLKVDDFDFNTDEFNITLESQNHYNENEGRTEAGLYFDNLAWDASFEKSGGGQGGTSKDFNIKIKRKFDAPYEKLKLNVTENYTKVWYEEKKVEDSDPTKKPRLESERKEEKRELTYELTIEYYNNILQPEMTVNANGKIDIAGATIFLKQRGIITADDTTHSITGKFNHGVGQIRSGEICISTNDGITSPGSWTTVGPWGEWICNKPKQLNYTVQVKSDTGEVVQEFKYHYNVPKMYIGSIGVTSARKTITNGSHASFAVFNIWEGASCKNLDVTQNRITGVDLDNYNESKGRFVYAPNLDAVGEKSSVTGANKYDFEDNAGNKITLTITGTLYKNKEDKPGKTRKTSGSSGSSGSSGGGGSSSTPIPSISPTPTVSPTTSPTATPIPTTIPDDKLWAVEFEYEPNSDGTINVYFKKDGAINKDAKYTLIDVNSDGKVDGISVVNDGNINALLLDTDNDGKFDAVTYGNDGTVHVRLFDLNNDGKLDTAVLDAKTLLDTNGDGIADTIDIGGNDRIKYPIVDKGNDSVFDGIDLSYDGEYDVSIIYKDKSALPTPTPIPVPQTTPETTPTTTEKVDYTNDINKLKEELNKFKEQLSNDKPQFESQINTIITKVQEEYNELTKKLEELNTQINDQNQTIAQIENILATVTEKSQRSSYSLELQQAKSSLALLESERYAVTSRIDNLALEYNNLTELIKLDQEIQELEKQKNEIQGVVDGFEVEFATYKTEDNQNNEQDGSEEKIQKSQEIADKQNDVSNRLIEQYQKLYTIKNDISTKQARQAQLIKDIESLLDKEFVELAKRVIETERKIQIYEDDIALLQTFNINGDLEGDYIGDDSIDSGHTQEVDIVGGNPGGGSPHGGGGGHGGGGKYTPGPPPEGPGYYEYWLTFSSASEEIVQDQMAGQDAEKKNIDASNGRGVDVAGEAIHLQIFPKRIDLRTRLAGMVWIDEDPQKTNNTPLGTKETSEQWAADNSVEIVVWKVKYEKNGGALREISREKAIGWLGTENDDGTFTVARTLDFIEGPDGTDYKGRLFIKDGQYQIDKIQVPAEEGLDTSKYKMAYDIEFVYDGQTYEATEFLRSSLTDEEKANKTRVDGQTRTERFKKTAEQTAGADKDYTLYKNDSYIIENADERKDFDSYFTEVYGKEEMKPEQGTSTEDGSTPITATTEGSATGSKGTGNMAKSQYEKVEYGDETKDVEAELHYESVDLSDATTRKITDLVTHDANGFILDQYKFAARTTEGGLTYAYEDLYHVKRDYYDNFKFQEQLYKPVDEYFTQINLGLVERYHTDISVLKDLYKAKVVVGEQENDYRYNKWGVLKEEHLHQTVLPSYRSLTYNIGLYNSDYNYRSSVYNTIEDQITKQIVKAIKDETELRLFVTYRIAILNESELTDVSINEFKDYYDKTFTLVGAETREKANDDKLNIDKETGNISAFISTSDTKDVAREEKIVAYKPYYRKLSINTDNADLYKWNKEDDLKCTSIDENVTGELDFTLIDTGNKDFKGSVTSDLNALSQDGKSMNSVLTLEPGEQFEIFVTYEVDQEGFKAIQEEKAKDNNSSDAGRDITRGENENDLYHLLGNKNNIAEVTTYSTEYTQEHKDRHTTTSFEPGQISGRIDRDSAPDNIIKSNITDDSTYEDDTESAPVLQVDIKTAESRNLNGTVWEDYRKDKEEGDGIYTPKPEGAESGDEPIKNMDVTLVEKISVTPDDLQRIGGPVDLNTLDYEFEYIWPEEKIEGLKSKTTTNDKGEYTFNNMVAGNYVVRFDYGNKEETLKYNGQDYKNTAYQTGMLNASAQRNDKGEIFKGNVDGTVTGYAEGQLLSEAGIEGTRTTLNNQWHDMTNKTLNEARVSDARDYEPRRLQVNAYSRTITNKNAEVLAAYINNQEEPNVNIDYYEDILKTNQKDLIDNTRMVANTAKIVIDIEKQSEITYDKQISTTEGDQNGQTVHDYTIPNIDFGLVERPETRMYIQKEIEKIELTKNDGAEVILSATMDEEGNIIKTGEEAAKSVRLDKITEITKQELTGQGFKYVAIDSSLLNGLKVNLTYKIKVYNESETDYITDKLSKIKNIQELVDLERDYEQNGWNNAGISEFNTGKDIYYGNLVGLHYYTNTTEATSNDDLSKKYKYNYNGDQKDVIVTTTVDQLVDYIDNDISIDKEDTAGIVNQAWDESTEVDRKQKLSAVSYIDNDKSDEKLKDNKGRSYIATNKNNITFSQNENMVEEPIEIKRKKVVITSSGEPETKVENGVIVPQTGDNDLQDVYTTKDKNIQTADISKYNPEITKELQPGDNTTIRIITTQQADPQSVNNMIYDNLIEYAMYSNTVGRRDMQTIPGNANMIAKENPAYLAGYDRVANVADDGTVTYKFQPKTGATVKDSTAKDTAILTERDAYAAKDTITFSEPTGLSLERQRGNTAIRIILISLIISAIAIMSATVAVVLKKTKNYDDKDLIKSNDED